MRSVGDLYDYLRERIRKAVLRKGENEMVLQIVYQIIVLLMICMSIWNMFRQEDFREQLASLLVICPLILRFLLIK